MEKMIELAKKIQEKIPGFTLGRGTSVMFKYHHRESIDLDLFREESFSFNRLSQKVRQSLEVQNEERQEDNLDFFIADTKVSFVLFPSEPVESTQQVKQVKMYSDYDLFLNKVYVAGRRIEPKDPATLLKNNNWSTEQIKQDFERKFPHQSFEIYLGALLSFEDYEPLEEWVKEELLKLKGG